MRKLLIFLAFVVALTASPQHLKFMGVPIDGTVASFAAKLQKKGFKVSPLNESYGSGVRVLEGTFSNMYVETYVLYGLENKRVFAVGLCVPFQNYSDMQKLYNRMCDKLFDKHDNRSDWEQDGFNFCEIIEDAPDTEQEVGRITLHGAVSETGDYELWIDYRDTANSQKYAPSLVAPTE